MDTQKPYSDSIYRIGLAILAISLGIYSIPYFTTFNDNAYFGLFALNYLLTIIYFFVLLLKKKFRKGSGAMPAIFVWLVIFLVSAYSLNRTIPVFEKSVPWLSAALVVCSVGYVLLAYFSILPRWFRLLHLFILGVSFTLFSYLAVYLFQLYPVSILLSPGVGMSLHSFVPILIVFFTAKQVYRFSKLSSSYTWSFITGITSSLLVAVLFTVSWNNLNRKVSNEFQKSLIADNAEIPAWVKIAQTIPANTLTEKYLKCDLVYSMPSKNWEWSMPSGNYDEVRKHDPLIMFAALFSQQPSLSQKERIKILECLYDAKHKTQERLWSGDNLVTQAVISNVRIWPETRIAYTEKTITVFCNESSSKWDRQHEAIYTFYLPEGGVVTSLSLWIDGKEEKGILTTKSKADSAYKTIVGVEKRDPSLVHWQEGNTVSVRVFPVLSGENRIFKIGTTAPLAKRGDKLQYENIYFKGPDATAAQETIQVNWVTLPAGMQMPDGFSKNGQNRFFKQTSYSPSWNMNFSDPGIKNSSFYFDGYTYSVKPYKKQERQVAFTKIYLDINKAWTKNELDEVIKLTKGRDVYVYDDGLVVLNDNSADMLATLAKRNFSIFPFYEVDDMATALIITKNNTNSPGLKDLKDNDFAKRLEQKINTPEKFNVYNIGNDLSPYLKTLKEHRVFHYDQGSLAQLKDILAKNSFAENIENDSQVVIDNADIMLTKTLDTAGSSAPDHLMRLFAYNHIMHKLGKGIFTNQESNDTLVHEAEQAYIVSPVSSLVVLESQADYDRFNIKKSKNSLDNASLNSSGAVPEPEEWALIIIACLAMAVYVYRNKFKQGNA